MIINSTTEKYYTIAFIWMNSHTVSRSWSTVFNLYRVTNTWITGMFYSIAFIGMSRACIQGCCAHVWKLLNHLQLFLHMLYFNFILGSFYFLCSFLCKYMIMNIKQKKIKIEPRIKLNNNKKFFGKWQFILWLLEHNWYETKDQTNRKQQ